MRENPDGFLCAQAAIRMDLLIASPGASRVAALFPVYRWDLIESLKPNDTRRLEDKVATGRSPAAPATLVKE
jgi:hypothetical protein